LFDDAEKTDTTELSKEYRLLDTQLSELVNYYKEIDVDDGQILEMCQLELLRIATMNLSGYDASIAQNNVQEALWSMQGIETAIKAFEAYTINNYPALLSYKEVLRSINKAKSFLKSDTRYDTFDRLKFITAYARPLHSGFIRFHNDCKLPWDNRKSALNLQEDFLSARSFNKQYFSIYYEDSLNLDLQAELGKKLFFEPGMSGNNLKSCASCHNPQLAFTDGKAKSISFDDSQTLERNAPTLLNVIYQKAFFQDGRAYQLEQQIFDVIHNQKEMSSNLKDIAEKLAQKEEYQKLFKSAFSGTADTAISPYGIQKAIAEYEKTLVSFNSPFDDYLKGNTKALKREEIHGYNLFSGKALCGSCHFSPLFNGTVPPFYNDSEFEVLGVPKQANNKKLDADPGRFTVTQIKEHKHAFKTPTLRNIALTAPYMHNGVYSSLEEVVEFYHKGGGAGLGFSVPNQTLPFDSLKLSATEKRDIVLFMKSLTDKAYAKQ